MHAHFATDRSSNHAVFHPEPSPTMPALNLLSVTAFSALPSTDGVILSPANASESVTHLFAASLSADSLPVAITFSCSRASPFAPPLDRYLGLQNRSFRPLAALVSVCVNHGSDR